MEDSWRHFLWAFLIRGQTPQCFSALPGRQYNSVTLQLSSLPDLRMWFDHKGKHFPSQGVQTSVASRICKGFCAWHHSLERHTSAQLNQFHLSMDLKVWLVETLSNWSSWGSAGLKKQPTCWSDIQLFLTQSRNAKKSSSSIRERLLWTQTHLSKRLSSVSFSLVNIRYWWEMVTLRFPLLHSVSSWMLSFLGDGMVTFLCLLGPDHLGSLWHQLTKSELSQSPCLIICDASGWTPNFFAGGGRVGWQNSNHDFPFLVVRPPNDSSNAPTLHWFGKSKGPLWSPWPRVPTHLFYQLQNPIHV